MEGNNQTDKPFGTIPQKPWHPGRGAKPDCIIHLNCREVCIHASHKTIRKWESFNNRGTNMVFLTQTISCRQKNADVKVV